MSLFNIFDPKKKQYQTPANQIQGSGYSSAYASNPTTQQSFSSAYSSPTQTMPKTPVPTPAPAPQKPQTPSYTPVRQVSSNQTTDYKNYQGSGYGSNYASNPTNYVPPTPRPTNTNQPDANTSWLNYVKNAAQRQAQFAQEMGQQGQDFIKQKYSLANQQLSEQLPQAQELFSKFKTNTEATIADLLASGEMQKSQAKDYYGDAQRQAAQTLRETQGQTQRTFANLGSLDSRGEGSYQQANDNTMSDFNRYTQQNLKAQADQLTQIDMAVASARREAEATIVNEEAKMNELARNIQYAIANNNLQQAQELTDAYNQSQQYIYDIQDSLAQTEYQFALEQEKLKNAMAQVSAAGLSPEFLSSGKPQTQADLEFIVRNPEGATAYSKLLGGNGGKQTEKQMAYTAAANIAQNALQKLNSGQVSTGFGQKLFGGIGETVGTNSEDQQAYRSDIAAMRTSIQNALLGANMSPKEMEQIMAAIPQFDDAPNIARSKLQSLITNLPIMAGSGQQVAQQYDQETIDQILASLGS